MEKVRPFERYLSNPWYTKIPPDGWILVRIRKPPSDLNSTQDEYNWLDTWLTENSNNRWCAIRNRFGEIYFYIENNDDAASLTVLLKLVWT